MHETVARRAVMLAVVSVSLSWAGVANAADPAAKQVESAESPEASPAEDPATTDHPDQQPDSTTQEKWKFATLGYAWLAGAWGKTDVIGPVQPVDVDLPFDKVLKAFKFAFMGAAEARNDRVVIVGDLTFIHLDANEGIGIRDPDFLDAELDTRTAEVTLLGGYRVANKGPLTLDLLAGGRLNFFKTSLQLEGPNRRAEGSVKQTWLDPLVAVRARASLGGRWSLSGYGDLGGVLFGSDITWQAATSVDYQLNRKMSLGLGWRYFKVDFDEGDFLYNVHQSGPLITFRTSM
jgi:hypothetical protein